MKKLVDRVAENKGCGGQSKQCRSLLQSILMSVMGDVKDSVPKEAIRCYILPSLSEGAAYRLMTKAG